MHHDWVLGSSTSPLAFGQISSGHLSSNEMAHRKETIEGVLGLYQKL